jgi:SAM-dependent methyltransferase
MTDYNRFAALKFFALTILVQVVASTFATGLMQFSVPLAFLYIVHSLLAGYLSWFFRMSRPWIFVNFMIPAGILISQAFPNYTWVWLALLIFYGLLYLPTFWTRVPYYPSSHKVYALIASELPADKAFRFLDIGCGNARLIKFLAQKFPSAEFEGIDLSPSAVLAAKFICLGMPNIKISLGNYWKKDFSNYASIYAFLSPTPMLEIETKAKNEMKPGSQLIINSFQLPNLKATSILEIQDRNQSSLYIYKF